MKNQFTLKFLKLTLVLVLVLFVSSCNDDNDTLITTADSTNQVLAKGAISNAKAAAVGLFSYSSSTVCLGDELTVGFDNLYGADSDCGEVQIQYSLNGVDWLQLGKGTVNNGVFSVTFTPVAGTYSFRADFNGNAGGCKDGYDSMGFSDNTVNETVVVVACGCDESFSYFDNGGGSYTFSYTPSESVENANVIFTFAQGVDVSGLNNWTENGVTRQMIMNLVACTTYTWTVTLTPNCSGHSQNSNVWTDFKVNNNDGDLENDSKKNEETPNIVIACPN